MYEGHSHDKQIPEKTNLPIAVVEVVDPVCLGVKMVDSGNFSDCPPYELPQGVVDCFEGVISNTNE